MSEVTGSTHPLDNSSVRTGVSDATAVPQIGVTGVSSADSVGDSMDSGVPPSMSYVPEMPTLPESVAPGNTF